MKDLSKEVTAELAGRLQLDQITLQRFYKSYGLDPKIFVQEGLSEISKFFPDTPVKVLKDVFEALQLYDLVELLEKVKPRTLLPAFPLKEIEKLSNASNRPTKFYSKAEVLIIYFNVSTADGNAENIGSFFKAFNSRSKGTSLAPKPVTRDLLNDVGRLKFSFENSNWWNEKKIEKEMRQKIEELQKENKKFETAVSTVMDQWIQQAQDEGYLKSKV